MCLDLTGPEKARTWMLQEISSSSTLCEENDQTLVKVKRDRPSTTQGKGIVGFCVGWDSFAVFTIECLIAQTRS